MRPMAKGKPRTKRIARPPTQRAAKPSPPRNKKTPRKPIPGAPRRGRPPREPGELGQLLTRARANGRLTFRDVEELAPAAFNDPGRLDRILGSLEERGVTVEGALGGVYEEDAARELSSEPDPLHLYFADMADIPLLDN